MRQRHVLFAGMGALVFRASHPPHPVRGQQTVANQAAEAALSQDTEQRWPCCQHRVTAGNGRQRMEMLPENLEVRLNLAVEVSV
jgi:hypothetical protein